MSDIANKIIKDNLDKTEEIYRLELQIETLNKAYDRQIADWKQCHENNDKLRIEKERLQSENAKLTEQLKNAVVLPYIRCVKGEWQLVRELGDYVTTIIYGKDMILAEQMLAELGGKE